MRTAKFGLSCLLLTAVVLFFGTGCYTTVRYYDAEHRDYHRWNRGEDRYYHLYWEQRHAPYREWTSLSVQDQNDYWRWRHDHP